MTVNRRDFLKITGGTAALIATEGCRGLGSGEAPPPGGGNTKGIEAVEHVIFTMQENRSFDHYFGKLPQYRAMKGYPGAVDGMPDNATNPSRDDPTVLIPAYHLSTQCHENLSPSWNESHRHYNRTDPASSTATLDGFVYTAANYSRNAAALGEPAYDLEGRRAMGYYNQEDIPYYYELASQFAISDRYFASVPSATQPNRMYLLAGSSFGYIRPLSEAEGDRQIASPTIFERLTEKGITWKIYLAGKGTPQAYSYYALFQAYNQNFDKIVDGEQFFADLASGNLPQVVMFESGVNTGFDEHPKNDIQTGAAYMARFFNAIMGSPIWKKSVTFLTYDEHGGFYDHVTPPSAPHPDGIPPKLRDTDTPGDFDRYGFRVPFIAVSPFSKKHYVSHATADHTSILKFIETRFNLQPLTNRDANAHDLTDMFDWQAMPFATPPALPSQPTDDTCNWSVVTQPAP